MSDRNNDVFQVLVASGNQAVLAAGQKVDDLAAGQIGVFDANTHKSISATTDPLPKDFYIVVGTTGNDFRESAGQHIQRRNVSGYTFGAHTAAKPMIVDITNIKGSCNEDYTIRVEQRNSKIAGIQGFNQFSEAFSVRGACCEGCGDDCQDADPNDIAIKLYNAINNNSSTGLSATLIANIGAVIVNTEPTTDGNVTVKLGTEATITVAILNADTIAGVHAKLAAAINAVEGTNYTAKVVGSQLVVFGPVGTVNYGVGTTGAVGTTVAVQRDGDVLLNYGPLASVLTKIPNGSKLGLSVQGAAVPTVQSDSINLAYHKFHQTYIIVSIVETDRDKIGCAFATTSVFQELREAEGTGANIRQKEYHASAWNGAGPYVASQTLGLAIGNLDYYADKNGAYDQLTLEYAFKADSGWLEYENTLSTIIAIPAASTTTRNGLITITDALLSPLGFDKLLDDAATASTNPAVVEAQPASTEVDGIA